MLLCCYHELSLDLIWLELQYEVLMVVCFVLISGNLCGLHGVLCVIKLCGGIDVICKICIWVPTLEMKSDMVHIPLSALPTSVG